MKTEGNEKT